MNITPEIISPNLKEEIKNFFYPNFLDIFLNNDLSNKDRFLDEIINVFEEVSKILRLNITKNFNKKDYISILSIYILWALDDIPEWKWWIEKKDLLQVLEKLKKLEILNFLIQNDLENKNINIWRSTVKKEVDNIFNSYPEN